MISAKIMHTILNGQGSVVKLFEFCLSMSLSSCGAETCENCNSVHISENLKERIYLSKNNTHFISSEAKLQLCQGQISETRGYNKLISLSGKSFSRWLQTYKRGRNHRKVISCL